jgi:hypothetical protein
MSDLSRPPLALVPDATAWRWPTPPFAGYPAAQPVTDVPCEIEGLTSAAIPATLQSIDLAAGTVQVRVSVTGTQMQLRLAQLRRIVLTPPLACQPPAAGNDPHAGMLATPPAAEYRFQLAGGGSLTGRSLGHVETEHGVFLFAPLDDAGTVQRGFVPRSSYTAFEIGPRIGDVLIEQRAATPEQVARAVAEQSELRGRKLGDILVANQVVSASQLLQAIEQQSRMPMVRIGEALVALELITKPPAEPGARAAAAPTAARRWANCWCAPRPCRARVAVGPGAQDGLPGGGRGERFRARVARAAQAAAVAAARRLQVLPLLLREAASWWRWKTRRAAAPSTRLEFIGPAQGGAGAGAGRRWARPSPRPMRGSAQDPWGGRRMPHPRSAWSSTPPGRRDQLLETWSARPPSGRDRRPPHRAESDNSLVRLINTMIIEAHAQGVSDIHIECQPGARRSRSASARTACCALPGTAAHLPQRTGGAHQDHVRPGHQRAPQAAGRQDQLRQVLPAAQARAARGHHPHPQRLEDVVMRLLASAQAAAAGQAGLPGAT